MSGEHNPNLSYVYQKITALDDGKHNLTSAVAYSLYKLKKIQFYTENNGNPSEEQLKTFHQVHMMDREIKGLRDQADLILVELLNAALSKKIEEIKKQMEANRIGQIEKNSETLKQNTHSISNNINTHHATIDTLIKTKINELISDAETKSLVINNKLDNMTNKGFLWWMQEIGRGVLITVASTFTLWLILVAFKGKDIQSNLENAKMPTVNEPVKQLQQPASEPVATQ